MTPTETVVLSVFSLTVVVIIAAFLLRSWKYISALDTIRKKSARLIVRKTANQNMSMQIFNETEQSLMNLLCISIKDLESAGKFDRAKQIKWLYRSHIETRNESAKMLNGNIRNSVSLTETMFEEDFPTEPDGDLIKMERAVFLEHVDPDSLNSIQPTNKKSEAIPIR